MIPLAAEPLTRSALADHPLPALRGEGRWLLPAPHLISGRDTHLALRLAYLIAARWKPWPDGSGPGLAALESWASGIVSSMAERRRPVWLRYVLVPGWNDLPEDIAPLAQFAAELGNVERVDVLPLHQLGAFKWKQLHFEYKLQDVDPPSKESIERTCALFKTAGLKAY